METVFSICEVLEISFFDLAALARKEEEVDTVINLNQERFFAASPAYFGIFKELYRGDAPEQVLRTWSLEPKRYYEILRKFEKLGLLEVLPGNRFRMKVRGNIRYAHNGPLATEILRTQIIKFLDYINIVLENDDVCMHSAEVQLCQESIDERVDEIHALGRKYRAHAFRDQSLMPGKKLRSVRWLFVLLRFRRIGGNISFSQKCEKGYSRSR